METVTRSAVWGVSGGSTEVSRAVRLLCMMHKWWMRITIPLSRPIQHAAASVDAGVNRGLRLTVTRQCRRTGRNPDPSSGDAESGEAVHLGDREYAGTSCAPQSKFL